MTMSHLLLSGVNFCTAQILSDTERDAVEHFCSTVLLSKDVRQGLLRPREIKASSSRLLCRFLITMVAIVGFSTTVTVSLLNQPPKRSQREWIKKEDLGNPKGFLDKKALQLNSVELQCPCKAVDTVAIPKRRARLVDFFLVKTDQPEIIVHLNSVAHFCGEVSKSRYFEGFNGTCNQLLEEGFRSSGWDLQTRRSNPYLYMNSLRTSSLNPINFMFDVCMSWAGGLSLASSFYVISNYGLGKEESERLSTFVQGMKTSLETCTKHTSWPPPNNSVYLAEAKLAGLDSSKFGYILVISFNLAQYFNTCAPSYCERVQYNSHKWLLFAALAQVGGFVSVVLFTLRSVLWPILCMIFGWRSSLIMYNESIDSKV